MSAAPPEKELFQLVLDLPASERVARVRELAGPDEALCTAVIGLLRAHHAAGAFLEEAPRMAVNPDPDKAGQWVGPFEILEQIGEGGFSTVWRARQTEPVRREVAVKIVKRGMASDSVVRRLEHERDALARMDHPHVAKILDGGAMADGRPWFAMEFVEGRTITEFCDAARWPTAKRLAVFADVCRAIQHGHHKGIVHRDMKPSNVLVSQDEEGVALPRVIDFGIAKWLGVEPRVAGAELTREVLLGTPEYMSPEQITDSADVDARTDVYSLGVLLYELVTGTRPFYARTHEGPLDVLNHIQAGELERPSLRVVRTSRQREILAARGCVLSELRGQLRGDVDWIVMCALAKNRDDRYATAAQLASDVERALRDEPVVAGPPHWFYRAAKFARRHRLVVGLGSLAVASLLVGAGLALYGMLSARESAVRERTAKQSAQSAATRAQLALSELEGLLFAADPNAVRGPDFKVRELLDEFAQRLRAEPVRDPIFAARLHAGIGSTYRNLGVLAAAETHLTRACEIYRSEVPASHPNRVRAQTAYASALIDSGRPEQALRIAEEILALPKVEGSTRLLAMDVRTNALVGLRRLPAGVENARKALAACVLAMGEGSLETLRHEARLAEVRVLAGAAEHPVAILRKTLARLGKVLPPHHPEIARIQHNLGAILERQGRGGEARKAYELALAGRLRVHGAGHPAIARTQIALGSLLGRTGDRRAGVAMMQRGVVTLRKVYGDKHTDLARALQRCADGLGALGENDAAIPMLREALAIWYGRSPGAASEIAAAQMSLGNCLWRTGKRQDGLAAVQVGLAAVPAGRPAFRNIRVLVLTNMGRMQHELGAREHAVAALREAVAGAAELWPASHPPRRLAERYLREAER